MSKEKYEERKRDRQISIHNCLMAVMDEIVMLPNNPSFDEERRALYAEANKLREAYHINRFGKVEEEPPIVYDLIEKQENLTDEQKWDKAFEAAHAAGKAACEAAKPTPVTWVESDLFGNVAEDAERYRCDEGLCGFAWVKFKGADRRTKWGKYLYNREDTSLDGYNKIHMWIRAGGQSVERKEAYAEAFCEVMVEEYGIECYHLSRLD